MSHEASLDAAESHEITRKPTTFEWAIWRGRAHQGKVDERRVLVLEEVSPNVFLVIPENSDGDETFTLNSGEDGTIDNSAPRQSVPTRKHAGISTVVTAAIDHGGTFIGDTLTPLPEPPATREEVAHIMLSGMYGEQLEKLQQVLPPEEAAEKETALRLGIEANIDGIISRTTSS